MSTNILENIIANKYETIKTNFKIACGKKNIIFDEDLFNDTYLNCFNALNGKNITEKNAIQYFWAAYSNNNRKKCRVSKYKPILKTLDEKYDDINDEKYCEKKYQIFDILVNSVTSKFGSEISNLWLLHFIENKTYNDLIEMGYKNTNFHNLFRKINSYIKNVLPQKTPQLKNLLYEVYNLTYYSPQKGVIKY